jgi:hypothetical protein
MREKIAGVLVLVTAAGLTADCRRKQEPAKTTTTTSAAEEAARRDHEIGITDLKVKTITAGSEYELTVQVHDPKGDMKPDDKAVAKYQIVCPGGSAHAVLSEPTRVEAAGEGRLIARHRVNLAQVTKGSEPCQIRLAVGHRYDFLSNELEGVLPAR